jgi:G3E family GTPase
MKASALIPVHILTGFLGSGKTTLLNRALQAGFGPETVVVVNEFGDAGLDPSYIQSRTQETLVMKSGCVCCTLRGDLPATLLPLVARRGDAESPLRRVVIETSGLSEPLPVLQTLSADITLRSRFRAGAVVCMVGAIDDQAANPRAEARAQITAADAIVVTKRDLADAQTADAVLRDVVSLNPIAEILTGTGEDFVRWLIAAELAAADPSRAPRLVALPPVHRAHLHDVRSIAIRAAAPPSWSRFAVWLTRLVFLHGDRILRTKGVLFDAERDVWIGVHGVKRYFHPPVHLAPSPVPADGTCLVFITEGLDPERIAESYRRLLRAP